MQDNTYTEYLHVYDPGSVLQPTQFSMSGTSAAPRVFTFRGVRIVGFGGCGTNSFPGFLLGIVTVLYIADLASPAITIPDPYRLVLAMLSSVIW